MDNEYHEPKTRNQREKKLPSTIHMHAHNTRNWGGRRQIFDMVTHYNTVTAAAKTAENCAACFRFGIMSRTTTTARRPNAQRGCQPSP